MTTPSTLNMLQHNNISFLIDGAHFRVYWTKRLEVMGKTQNMRGLKRNEIKVRASDFPSLLYPRMAMTRMMLRINPIAVRFFKVSFYIHITRIGSSRERWKNQGKLEELSGKLNGMKEVTRARSDMLLFFASRISPHNRSFHPIVLANFSLLVVFCSKLAFGLRPASHRRIYSSGIFFPMFMYCVLLLN